MQEICSICEGSGLLLVERPDGSRAARECECRRQRRAARIIARTKIPKRYEHCTLENFETDFKSATKSLRMARLQAQKFVESNPIETGGMGLLLTGSIGAGKTHLAVGILQALVAVRGASGLFCDYRDLLKQVQNSYNRQVQATELEVLEPVFTAEVLLLDELGAQKPTGWVWDTVAHILNTRYNNRLTTIITTNYANAPSLGSTPSFQQSAGREDTLGDRIGDRMHSRLQEMCVIVEMEGEDARQTIKRGRFG